MGPIQLLRRLRVLLIGQTIMRKRLDMTVCVLPSFSFPWLLLLVLVHGVAVVVLLLLLPLLRLSYM